MRLDVFDLDGRQYCEANVWEENGNCLYLDFYTTKSEAIKEVKAYKKSYKGTKELDCFVRLHDENGFGIADYDV